MTAATAIASGVAGVLVIAAPDTAAVPPTTTVGGLALLRRIVLAAERAGFERVLVRDDGGGVGRLLDGTRATALSTAAAPAGPRRVIVLAADVVPQPQWLQALLALPAEAGTVYTDGTAVALVDTAEPARVLGLVADARSARDMMDALRRSSPAVERALEPQGRFRLVGGHDVDRANGWLLRGLIKQNEGFMSRHVERRVSLALTGRLAATRITPNAMTVVSLLIGLGAAPFFLSTAPAWQLAGALLFLLHSILDGCDGELARLRFQESRGGAILDFWGDNTVHAAVFGCIALGWSLSVQAVWPLIVGAVSVASTLGAAAALSRSTMDDTRPDGSLGARLAGALAHRDFIYVVIVLSALGKASWFLILSAAGTPLFLLLLLVSGPRPTSTASR